MALIRLDKILAHSGYGTRKEVKEIIRKGYVLVNGETIKNDDFKVDDLNDEIIIFGDELNYEDKIYLMLNKPDGYISATYDNYDKTVIDLIGDYKIKNPFPVGRLDKDSVGLLLITNDGMLAHNLLSPKKHVDKTYYIEFEGNLSESKIKKLEEGVILDDGYHTHPSKYNIIDNNKGEITIDEGKFHQVKRMLQAVGCNVTYLKRIKFGPLSLDKNLKEGEFRLLTKEELDNLINR
jgi:16S rRNA pseudouridine516 synthase